MHSGPLGDDEVLNQGGAQILWTPLTDTGDDNGPGAAAVRWAVCPGGE